MAVTALIFTKFPANIMGGEVAGDAFAIDYLSDTIRIMLCTSTYAPNQDTHETKADVTNEVVGAGYAARGNALAGKTITVDAANNRVVYDANDSTWAASTITARYAVIYKDTGVDATSVLIGYIDFGADKSTVATDFTIEFSADGVFRAAVS